MACFATITGKGMVGGFSSSRTVTIVTPARGTCLPGYRGMIKIQLQPVGGVVAHFATAAGGNMVGTFAN